MSPCKAFTVLQTTGMKRHNFLRALQQLEKTTSLSLPRSHAVLPDGTVWDHMKCWISSVSLYEHFAFRISNKTSLVGWDGKLVKKVIWRKDQYLLACWCKLSACVWEQLFFSLRGDCGYHWTVGNHVVLHCMGLGSAVTQPSATMVRTSKSLTWLRCAQKTVFCICTRAKSWSFFCWF